MTKPSRWITVGELAQAFAPDSNAGDPSDSLAGRTVRLHFEDGQVTECRFDTADTLSWTVIRKREVREETTAPYLAFEMRPGIYFVDFGRPQEQTSTVTLVLDSGLRIVTALYAVLPGKKEALRPLAERAARGEELTAVGATFLNGSVDQEFGEDTPRHPLTSELVGKRVEYTYSPTERYEHIYLNESFYTWQCLSGAEKGLADTDRCHYYKIADRLYFFVWREKIIPTIGAALVDFDRMRSAGKILGYRADDLRQTVNFAIGARARLVNETVYDR
jgi:hypothetical protein